MSGWWHWGGSVGAGEGDDAVSVRVEGRVSGLTEFRFELYHYFQVRLSTALIRPSTVPPLYFMQMIAAKCEQVNLRGPDRSGPERCCPWRGFVTQWVRARHPRDTTRPYNFLQDHL